MNKLTVYRTVYNTYQVKEMIGGKVHYESTNKTKAQGVYDYILEKELNGDN